MNRAAAIGVGIAGVLLAAAFAIMVFAPPSRDQFVVVLRLVPLAAGAIVLQLTLSWARRNAATTSAWLRRAPPLALFIFGAGLLVVWRGNQTGGVGLAGLCAIYLAFGQGLAGLRASERWAGPVGRWVGLGTAVGYVLGLLACLWFSGWALALTLVALLVAPVAITLLSEVVPKRPSWRPRRAAAIGAGSLVVGLVWLLIGFAGLPPLFALVIAGALLLVVGAIASSSQADVLLVASAAALIAFTLPDGEPPRELRPGQATLVAFGDSYMSGEGARQFFEGTNVAGVNECRRAPTAYAQRTVDAATNGLVQLAFLACSGAVVPDVLAKQVPRARALADVRLAIISLGGNDVGFAEIGEACLAPGSCAVRGQIHLDLLRALPAQLDRAYAAVHGALPGVPVVAIPYPQPLNEVRCSDSPLTPAEFAFVPAFITQLNGVVRDAARVAHFYYLADMANALKAEGLRLCDPSGKDPGIKYVALSSLHGSVDQVLFPRNWIHNSLHPNEEGHAAMAKVLEAWLRDHPRPAFPADQPLEPFTPVQRLTDMYATAPVDYCRSSSPRRYCDRENVHEWTITQLGLALWDATPALGLVALGAWLLWLPVLGWTGPRWRARGDRIANWFA